MAEDDPKKKTVMEGETEIEKDTERKSWGRGKRGTGKAQPKMPKNQTIKPRVRKNRQGAAARGKREEKKAATGQQVNRDG